MLKRLGSLSRGTKTFLAASLVPPAGLLLESLCAKGFCSACPLSGGCVAIIALGIGGFTAYRAVNNRIGKKDSKDTLIVKNENIRDMSKNSLT